MQHAEHGNEGQNYELDENGINDLHMATNGATLL